MPDWFETLNGLWSASWRLLVVDAAQLKPSTRTVLATISHSGAPEARVVVLRGADRQSARIDIHTDAASVKIKELGLDPRASLLIWSDNKQLQLRMRGEISIATGAEARPHWARVPDGSRANYGVTPTPGTAISASDAYTRAPDPAKFAVLTLTLSEADVVHLSDDYHRRALFRRDDGWQGQWLAP